MQAVSRAVPGIPTHGAAQRGTIQGEVPKAAAAARPPLRVADDATGYQKLSRGRIRSPTGNSITDLAQ